LHAASIFLQVQPEEDGDKKEQEIAKVKMLTEITDERPVVYAILAVTFILVIKNKLEWPVRSFQLTIEHHM